jgi:hypothetical protein
LVMMIMSRKCFGDVCGVGHLRLVVITKPSEGKMCDEVEVYEAPVEEIGDREDSYLF